MSLALIGHSGFVGTTLKRQIKFDEFYRSTDIEKIRGRTFDLVVCAGAPAQKWIANQQPEADNVNIQSLQSHLRHVQSKRFILISTVDVFANPICVNENTPIVENDLHPYGLHRRRLEKFVEENFSDHLIIRLPGLVGPWASKECYLRFFKHE